MKFSMNDIFIGLLIQYTGTRYLIFALDLLLVMDCTYTNIPSDSSENGASASGSWHLALNIKDIISYFLTNHELMSDSIDGDAESMGLNLM